MIEYIEFSAPEIGLNETKKIKPSNRNMRKIWNLQLIQAKAFSSEGKELQTFDDLQKEHYQAIELLDKTEEFLTTTLGLNKKQQDRLEDLTNDEIGELSGRLQYALSDINPNAEDTDKEDEPDPKSDSENASES
ncbi:phage tail tube assembly chaperone [Levilactobacillus yonginensis]